MTRISASASVAALTLALTLGMACGSSGRGAVAPGDVRAAVDSIATRAMSERQLPGLTVVVLDGDDTVVARGYGVLRRGTPAPVTPATVFQLGSITKQFIAALVVALAEEGRLSLDSTVRHYLPDYPALPADVQVRHLLNHTSGWREIFTLEDAAAGYDDLTRPRAELEPLVKRIPFDTTAGSRWSYSNTNYVALTFLVERLTEMSFEEALAQRFFRPHQLASLAHCPSLPRDGDAHGHVRRDTMIVAAAPENMSWILGEGGLCGNALDLARWTRLLATGRIVPLAAYERMITPASFGGGRRADYGFGLSLVDLDGVTKIGHNGAMRGFSASAAYYPDSAVTVVVLTNRGDVRTEALERAIARRALGLPAPPRREHALAREDRRRFVGTYDIGVFDARVVERAGALWLETPPPGPTTRLAYLGNGEFAAMGDPDATRVQFTDSLAPARAMRLYMGAMHWYGRRRR